MDPIYTLAISSFAVHGTASLKSFTSILGSRVLPVPTVMLNGLTNLPLVRKFDLPFRELLESTFELVVHRGQTVILYVGYLGKAEQIDILLETIGTYRSHIRTILIDPICGDHGKAYVSEEIIRRWPELIRVADLVFPNLTEMKLLTGHPAADTGLPDLYIQRFREQFPRVQVVATSLPLNDHEIGIGWHNQEDAPFTYSHPRLAKNYGGTGDAFVALFILQHYYYRLPMEDALKAAAHQTYLLIQYSIQRGADELLLDGLDVTNPVICS